MDALFNTKAAEATQKKISIDFEVNDLSNLPFDVSDMVVLLSNLLDNAIEACQQYDKGDKAIHVMAVAQQDFFISVRNTSEPVVIISGSIPTTKPEPQMHGFGLANIRLILENTVESIRCSMKMGGSSSPLIYRSPRFRDRFSPSYYRNVDNIACCVYSVRKDGTMHKSKGVTPMQQYSFE